MQKKYDKSIEICFIKDVKKDSYAEPVGEKKFIFLKKSCIFNDLLTISMLIYNYPKGPVSVGIC